MTCRMSERQRKALIGLIGAMIKEAEDTDDCNAFLNALEAERNFHKCFWLQAEDDLDDD